MQVGDNLQTPAHAVRCRVMKQGLRYQAKYDIKYDVVKIFQRFNQSCLMFSQSFQLQQVLENVKDTSWI